jgi:hypothetical protein
MGRKRGNSAAHMAYVRSFKRKGRNGIKRRKVTRRRKSYRKRKGHRRNNFNNRLLNSYAM